MDPHPLLHSYGSNKIRDRWGLMKISTTIGHANISITSKAYSHLLDGDLKSQDGLLLESAPPGPETTPDLVPGKELCALISELEGVLALLKQRAEPDPVLHTVEGGRKRVLHSG